MTQQPAGWYTDPTGRHTYRYWDGSTWTNQVSDGGTSGADPNEMDEASSTVPPAPGTRAPGSAPEPSPTPPQSSVEVSQRSGGVGLGALLGVLIGAAIVILIIVMVFNNSSDDGSTSTTGAPVTTVAPSTTMAPTTTGA